MNNQTQLVEAPLTESTDDNQLAPYAPRNPIFAALMSAILPGFGQLYNGQINKSLWIFLAFCLLAMPLTVVVALYLPVKLTAVVLALASLMTLAVWLYGIVDAWITARNQVNFRLQPWQANGMYTAVFLICSLLILPSMIFWVRDNQVQSFSIPSNSMSPTVMRGDILFADKNYNCPYCRTSVSRGDVAIFVFPNNRNNFYIKRVLGLPGDKIQITEQGVSLNGTVLGQRSTETESIETIEDKSWTVAWNEESLQEYDVTVSPGHAFVLGDNRSKSNDSRVFGLVPLSDIVGLPRQIWFSKGPDGIRWSRMGKSTQPMKR